jgi:hypothetical protein
MDKCHHCGHRVVFPDAHARYKPYDKTLPKRCRWCRYCDKEFGPLPPIDD